VAVAYELLLQTGRQPFVPAPVFVLIAVVLAIIAAVLPAILPVMVAAIFIPVLGFKGSQTQRCAYRGL
jgi:hypothetical protein